MTKPVPLETDKDAKLVSESMWMKMNVKREKLPVQTQTTTTALTDLDPIPARQNF
jgi:hypothetical protein